MGKAISSFFVEPLYSRMADDLHLAEMSQRTHDVYLWAVPGSEREPFPVAKPAFAQTGLLEQRTWPSARRFANSIPYSLCANSTRVTPESSPLVHEFVGNNSRLIVRWLHIPFLSNQRRRLPTHRLTEMPVLHHPIQRTS